MASKRENARKDVILTIRLAKIEKEPYLQTVNRTKFHKLGTTSGVQMCMIFVKGSLAIGINMYLTFGNSP